MAGRSTTVDEVFVVMRHLDPSAWWKVFALDESGSIVTLNAAPLSGHDYLR
jgi:hypothetical protein